MTNKVVDCTFGDNVATWPGMTRPLDSLGDRMKGYERASRTVLVRRMPLILRIDGKAFHTYLRGCERPFDVAVGDAMVATARELMLAVPDAVFAFTQSDEISLLLHNYKRLASQPWFDNQVQKLVSVSASIAAAEFTRRSQSVFGEQRPAYFDARAFVLPESEVVNYFLWRQQDATRNSIQMLARSIFSHAQCHEKNTSELQEMCFQKGHNWNAIATRWKRGVTIYGRELTERVDFEPPIFSQDRAYIEQHLAVVDERAERAERAALEPGERGTS